jgi:DNA-binding beta-propeller fold protein YncE
MKPRNLCSAVVATALLGLLCLRCGADGADGSNTSKGSGDSGPVGQPSGGSLSNSPGGALAGSTAAGGSANSGGGGGMPPIVVPPETELEESFLAPVVTGRYVFSANPKSGRVAVIDAETYAVRLFNAGFGPTYLAAIPGERGAIVINTLSLDATLFRLEDDEVEVEAASLKLHAGANAWAVSPDGRFAIAWTRTEVTTPDPTSGSQDITVLDLEQLTSQRLSVGFHPTQVTIDETSQKAFVVSDDGVSVVELGDEPSVSLLAHVSEDPLEEAAARDVSITPDGAFAVVRVEGSNVLRLVDLSQENQLTLLDLGAPIADVDLSRDGALALAAVPGYRQIVLVPIPPEVPAEELERVTVPGEIPSSVTLSDESELALLYQNGADNSHLTVLDLREDMQRALRTVDVKGPVRAAFAAPGGASAIAFQKPMAGSNRAGLFSGVPTLQKRAAKLVGTDAVPNALAFDSDGRFALVTVGSDKSASFGVYRVRLDTLQEDFLELASPPSVGATGIVEQVGRGFVAQQHPEGRITFIELDSARAHTITGFELAARILQ